MSFLFDDKIRYDDSPNLDAFGRLRVSNPFTLFDSFHRYGDNGKINEYVSGSASSVHDANSGSIVMTIGTSAGDKIYRESARAFAYQPGKSLLVLQTFCMNEPKANVRQRQGYFDVDNGFYIELDGTTLSLVRRSNVTGTIKETRINQKDWNIDRLDGYANTTNPSGITLDTTKTQILFTDIEWLGVGTSRMGFVIDGQFIVCHKFHHANQPGTANSNTSLPYMTTACLPVRAEFENTGTTASNSSYRLICTSVISEGGYELRGRSRSAGLSISSPKTLTATNTIYPLMSIRLKSNRMNGIAVPKKYNISPISSGLFQYMVMSGTTTGGTWANTGTNSCVEYNLNPTSVDVGNTTHEMGYINSTNQSGAGIGDSDVPFKYSLERNTFTGVAQEFIIAVVTTSASSPTIVASINWDEIT